MLLRALLLLPIIFVVAACGSDYPFMFSIDNSDTQKELVSAVRESGIDVRIDEKGRLWYSSKDRKIVEAIAHRAIAHSEHKTKVTLRYPDPKYTDKLIEELNAAGIPYETVERDGQLNIQLRNENRDEWETVKERIDGQFYAEAREELNQNGL